MKPGVHPDYGPVVTAASHPFWTGAARVLDSAGQVEEFRRRYGSRSGR